MTEIYACRACGESFPFNNPYAAWEPRHCRECYLKLNPPLTPQEVLRKYRSGPTAGMFTSGRAFRHAHVAVGVAVQVEEDREVWHFILKEKTATHHRMALRAALAAIEHLPGDAETVLFVSYYVHSALTKWSKGWKEAGWKRKGGKPIAHEILIRRALELLAERKNIKLAYIPRRQHARWDEYARAIAYWAHREEAGKLMKSG